MSYSINPQFSKETAFRLWMNGKMPDSYFVSHYMTPSEAREYYHQKMKQQAKEEAEKKAFEKEVEKQIDEKIVSAIETALNAF